MPDIPICGEHRGVGLHAGQSPERLRVVAGEIDHILDHVHDPEALFHYVCDPAHAPEARILAGAKIAAHWDLAASERRSRPILTFDLAEVDAVTSGLTCVGWQHPSKYCCIVEADRFAADREVPLP